ncbi:MAG: hypothetical protein CM15mP22_8320 [Gammaproteobacteria bacterium]|nr:MAG: hypothetical protein CM15mP22_8320 [Gammaproteobacteria bacterium]
MGFEDCGKMMGLGILLGAIRAESRNLEIKNPEYFLKDPKKPSKGAIQAKYIKKKFFMNLVWLHLVKLMN